MRELTFADERFLSRIVSCDVSVLRSFLDEPFVCRFFARHLESVAREMRLLPFASADLYAKKVLCQYAAVRASKPEVVVETGIASGVSSAYILLAMKKNGCGQLHSIGLADPADLPPGQKPGWLVPSELREPWCVHLGDARDLLPGLLRELRQIDVFIHDSDHSYHHMLWEFESAYPFLKERGLLISDDALWNKAFPEFASRMNSPNRIIRGVGFMRKGTG